MNYLLVVQVFALTPYPVLPGQFSVKINTLPASRERQQTVRPFAEVDGMAGEEDPYTCGDHAERTARITRCRCTSSICRPARTIILPMMISTTGSGSDTTLFVSTVAAACPDSSLPNNSLRQR